ncbi:MAG: aldo/keto reductase [Desulfovibrionaceae bacterium]|nr:aldo/keto reductase [Desulfovibrionaceae bacterium]
MSAHTLISRRSMLRMAAAAAGAAALQGAPILSGIAAAQAAPAAEYRELPRVPMKISTVGIGAGNLRHTPPEEIAEVIALAMDHGISFMDMLLPYGPFPQIQALASAIRGRRDRMVTQMHIGSLFRNGQYTRSRSVRLIRQELEEQLDMFGGYFDIGLLHYVDQKDDFEEVMNDGMFDYAVRLKRDGKIRALGFSTHSTEIARLFMAEDAFDVFMFSLNPSYDFDFVNGHLVPDGDRTALYQEAARRGVGIVCMKTYGGGRLLDRRTSPFGRAMTPSQCIQYALDRPAVVTCPVGVATVSEMQGAIDYYSASREERSYAFIGELQRSDVAGNCVYCNHCLPCPASIDIGAATKYYDLALAGDEFAKDHYRRMAHTAADCIYCGRCEPNCPFHVNIMDNMKKMTAFFAQV